MPIAMINRCCLCALLAALLPITVAAQEPPPVSSSKPLSPAEALAKFVLAEPELKIELAAAEPEVVDPVAIRFDEKGRMWVAEMRDYPLGPPPGEAPLSRIKVLEDRDADGRFETATVFADKLSFVTGLQPWRGGVIVTLSGRIAWMKDADGDGKMDVDETWYTGFAEQNSQLRANHPRLALDNHVYVANGLRGGVVVNKRLPDEKPIDLRGRDFRFDPLTGKAEAVSGNGQFGLCFDDWGNRFTCTNRNPVIHVVLEDRYLKLAPKIPVPSVVQDVAAAAEQSKVYPISRAWTTSNLHAGTFTAACGVHVYRSDFLFRVLGNNSVFTCDPTGNFVHMEKMRPDGPSFTSKPAYEGKEFLASTDEWFRPVSVETGPDGCLYIVDMYRCVIEHPDFVPDELKRRPDMRLGDDRGRIWRITLDWNEYLNRPQTERPSFPEVRQSYDVRLEREASKLPDDLKSLIGDLGSKNVWKRETAQRLLLEQAPPKVTTLFRDVLRDAAQKDKLRAAKMLWLMHSWHKDLDDQLFATYLNLTAEELSRQALLIAEDRVRQGTLELRHVKDLRPSTNPAMRFQQLMFDLARRDDATERIVISQELSLPAGDRLDRWQETALLLRYHKQLIELFQATTELEKSPVHLQREIARLIGSRGTDHEAMLLLKASRGFPTGKLILVVDELARGLQQRNRKFEDVLNELIRKEVTRWDDLFTDWSADAMRDKELTLEVRIAAARVLGFLPKTTPHLAALIIDNSLPQELQSAVVAALALRGTESTEPWKQLLDSYDSQPLPIKRALIDNSFRRADGPALLLEQVKAGIIQPAEIDPLKRKTLLENKDAAIKKLAEELFAALNPANRQQALEDYQPVLKLTADANKGKLVFEKNCSTCHKVGDIGVNVAPDISDTRTKTAAQLLADIIQPNRAIDSNYIGYQVLLKDGTSTTGLLAQETSTSLTLKQPGGKVLTVARDEVEQIKASGVSLMPDGLEKNIPPEAMADLLSYLKNWRYLDGKTPLSPQ